MEKLLIVCGPTATGKTSLAIHLAKVYSGEIVSADSRQVYRGMDIGTGKDLQRDSKFRFQNSKLGGYYEMEGIKIWGYDLVDPKKEFSVGQYIKYADAIIKNIRKRKKLPILVGGTGLYIAGVVDGIPTAEIPKNKGLRKSLQAIEADELFETLANLDPTKAASMNVSDKKNPRRLIRAIEIADFTIRSFKKIERQSNKGDVMFIGLKAPKKYLYGLIEKRVKARVDAGLQQEIESLIANGISWNRQAMTALGYSQWKDYFRGKASKNEVIKRWKSDEKKYAKRQLAWFKRDKRINWLDITKGGWRESVEKLVKKWYSSNQNGATEKN